MEGIFGQILRFSCSGRAKVIDAEIK